jgi:hypothetical protein
VQVNLRDVEIAALKKDNSVLQKKINSLNENKQQLQTFLMSLKIYQRG